METRTPTQVAVEIWGKSMGHSRSSGAWKVRDCARRLYPRDPSEERKHWHLTPDQVAAIKRHL